MCLLLKVTSWDIKSKLCSLTEIKWMWLLDNLVKTSDGAKKPDE